MCSNALNSRGKPLVSPMSGSPTYDIDKKSQKRGEFKTTPRPTGKRSNNCTLLNQSPCIPSSFPHFYLFSAHHTWSDFLPAFFLKFAYCFSKLYVGSWCVFSSFLNATLPCFLASCKSVSKKNIVQRYKRAYFSVREASHIDTVHEKRHMDVRLETPPTPHPHPP